MTGMHNLFNNLEDIHATLQDDEYIDTNGVIRCKACKGERMVQSPFSGKYSRVLCSCKYRAKEKARRHDEWVRRVQWLRKQSLLDGKYENVTFDNACTSGTSEDYRKVFARCQRYASIPDQVLENGYGIYLFGGCGSGKTYLTACVANELLGNGYSCIFTNMINISQQIRATFGKYGGESEESIVDRLSRVEFLFIDDIGTERVIDNNGNESWLQDIIYTIFNNRYMNKKPTIFTSNYSLVQLSKDRGLMRKITDRIAEMTAGAVMELKDKFRQAEVLRKTRECPF